MEPTQQLIDDIFRSKVLRARQQRPEEKLCAGIELFAEVCDRMRDGIRWQFPQASNDEVERILRERLRRVRQLDEHNIYTYQPITEPASER